MAVINKKYKSWYISSIDDGTTITLEAIDKISNNRIRISLPASITSLSTFTIDDFLIKLYELIDTYDKTGSKTSK